MKKKNVGIVGNGRWAKIMIPKIKKFANVKFIANSKTNYKKFKLSEDVKIYNNNKKFVLKTDELTGVFDTGDMFANSPVKIQIKNSKIQGSSLNLKNYGEYIKVLGKASLTINEYDTLSK